MRIPFVPSDLAFVPVALLIFGAGAVAAYCCLRLLAGKSDSVLTRTEWRVLLELVGIFVFALLLLFVAIAVEFPQEMFIYGRF